MTGSHLLRIVIIAVVVAIDVVIVLSLLGMQRNAGVVAAIAAGVTAGPMALIAMRKNGAN